MTRSSIESIDPDVRRPRASLVMASLLLMALALTACETAVDPIVEGDEYFSLYGFLDMERDTQFVRVEPISGTLRRTDPSPLDVRATITNLTNGDSVACRDSVVTFSDGTFGHVFWAPVKIISEHTYRFEVERPDGARTWAETTVPPRPLPVVDSAKALIHPDVVRITQRVRWRQISRAPFTTEVWYRFFPEAGQNFTDLLVPPDVTGLEGDIWTVQIDLERAGDSLQKWLGTPRVMGGVSMTVRVQDAAWTFPGGVFDPDLLSSPGVFSNVMNGFGYVGSVGSFSTEWTLTPRVIRAMGFVPPDMQERGGRTHPLRPDGDRLRPSW